MKNVTLSADEDLIEAARERARSQNTTLNEAFRQWLREYSGRDSQVIAALETVERIRAYARTGGRRFTREEMNER